MNKNIIFFHGDDKNTLLEETRGIISSFVAEHGDHNYEKIWGDEVDDFSNLSRSLETLPFIGTRRLVVLRDPWNTRKSIWRGELTEFLKAEKLPETTVLVITEMGNPDKRETLFKFLQKSATAKEFARPSPNDLAKKVVADIGDQGGRISLKTALELVNRISSNTSRLPNEIQRLLSVTNDQEITSNLIQELVPPADPSSDIFALTDALGARHSARALAELHKLIESGENEFRILATLSTHFRNLILLADLMQRNPKAAASADKELKLHPFVVKKGLAQIRNFSSQELKTIYQRIADLDYAFKTTDNNLELQLQRLCTQICIK